MPTDPYQGLSDTLSLVYDGISAARKGLLKNPNTDEKRKLDRRIVQLEGEATEIKSKMDAIEDGDTAVKGPTDGQVKKVTQLTGEVETMTGANITASKALALVSKIMNIATKVADA